MLDPLSNTQVVIVFAVEAPFYFVPAFNPLALITSTAANLSSIANHFVGVVKGVPLEASQDEALSDIACSIPPSLSSLASLLSHLLRAFSSFPRPAYAFYRQFAFKARFCRHPLNFGCAAGNLRSLVLLHGPLNAHHPEVNALKCGDGVS